VAVWKARARGGVPYLRFYRTTPESERRASLLVTAVGNLQTASTLPLVNNLAVERAQLDLPNVTASDVGLFGDQRRALQAATSLALRNVFAAVNANGRRRGVKVWLKHKRMMCLSDERFKDAPHTR
jgi:hypothetical protein